MSINGIRNPKKLRKITALIGEPCIYAAARYFEKQQEWLAFGMSGATFVVNLRQLTCEPYTDESVEVARDADGNIRGIRQKLGASTS